MTALHQFLPTLASRDASGGHVRNVRRVLRDAGIESEIFAGEVQRDARGEARHYREFDGGGPGTFLLYHASIGCAVAPWVLARPEPKLVDYHNITPPAFFEAWQPEVATLLAMGRRQLADFAEATVLGLADSAFNESELQTVGFERTAVVPILLDPTVLATEVDDEARERLAATRARGGSDWLFVGRVAPNKAQHDLVKAFAVYRRVYDPLARLHLVGDSSSPHYLAALHRYVDDLGLDGAVDFAGSVAPGVLGAHYATADVFVCLSEHEGFCVPLLEAMHCDLPVVAFAAAAVPETLGDAGLLLDTKRPAVVAAAAARVCADDGLRGALVEAGRARLAGYDLARSSRRLLDAVLPILEGTRP